MKTEFVLRIEIGNDETLGDANLAGIVKKVSERIEWCGYAIEDNRSYRIRDRNGNVVGQMGRYISEDEG